MSHIMSKLTYILGKIISSECDKIRLTYSAITLRVLFVLLRRVAQWAGDTPLEFMYLKVSPGAFCVCRSEFDKIFRNS